MPTVKQVIDTSSNATCSTTAVRGLSLEIIGEMNLFIPNVLVAMADLSVRAESAAVNLVLQPAAKEALRRAIARRNNEPLLLTSAYRTVAQQHVLRSWYERGRCDIGAAAKPGLSNHEDGLALDTPDFSAWRRALEAEGWDWFGDNNARDPVHFTYLGRGARQDVGDIGVKAFQRLWNRYNPGDRIDEDGDFGPRSAQCMNQAPADGFGITRLLRVSTPPLQGEDVTRVQQILLRLGLLGRPYPTGSYDATTAAAVKQFQDQKGLAPDGIVGPQTWRRLSVL